MSTERPTFGLNSILPTGYKTKAEAFARCLQDKLRLLGYPDEPTENGHGIQDPAPATPPASLEKFSDEQIAENVFLQGPLSYKRRSVPENGYKPYTNGNARGKYPVSLVDRRGFSSDSEDSDVDDPPMKIEHPRVEQIQNAERVRLTSANSNDSTSSWCSCENDENLDEDDKAEGLAAQIRGSPTINNSRLRNFKRRGRDDRQKVEKQISRQDSDLFFDFDTDCFSPVNLDEDDGCELNPAEETIVSDEGCDDKGSVDTGQDTIEVPDVLTPPPSPISDEIGETLRSLKVDGSKEDSALEVTEDYTEDMDENDDESILVSRESEKAEETIETCEEVTESPIADTVADDIEMAEDDVIEDVTNVDEIASTMLVDDNVPIIEISEPVDCDINLSACADEYTHNQVPEEPREESTSQTIADDDADIDESYLPPPRMKLRRCSSLKTWKTPPGTPGRKKIVRFADALGLDLADVRMFLDEVPKIPISAFDDLHYEIPAAATVPSASVERTLIPMFQQPNAHMDFLQRVRQNNVCLESAILTDANLLAISGVIRVRNLSFHKTVHVRYTKDSWASFSDLQATFVPNSSDGFCDNFSFVLYGHTLNIGDRLEFAIRYDSACGQYWDSNGGVNYVFQCMPRSPAPYFPPLGSSPTETWTKFY